MVRIFAVTNDLQAIYDISLEKVKDSDIKWFWVDFQNPTSEENALLKNFFAFHPLAIEDCLYSLNHPKLDYHTNYNFFILNALNPETLEPEEVDLFVGEDYLVSYHQKNLPELDQAWSKVTSSNNQWDHGVIYVAYQIMDKIVDCFFPAFYHVDDHLSQLDDSPKGMAIRRLMDEVFKIRGDLLKLRRIINSMRDLLYRILNSERLIGFKEHKLYFSDIHDHLLKLSSLIEASREITADMRDSYLSINSNRMNANMMVLTVITTIFIPLTFIAGVYGMNFEYMPELKWRYGYYIVLAVMGLLAFLMFLWFKIKGWFDS